MRQHTFVIYLMYFICFKLINYFLIIIYDLNYQKMGLLIIKGYNYAWVLYSIVGIGLPLLLYRIWELYLSQYSIDAKVYPLIEKALSRK